MDWEAGATLPNYVRAAANTRLIGKQLAFLLKNLQEHKRLDLSHVHVIGFSLGAHVSGFAGSEIPGLRRITGLFSTTFRCDIRHQVLTHVDVIEINNQF